MKNPRSIFIMAALLSVAGIAGFVLGLIQGVPHSGKQKEAPATSWPMIAPSLTDPTDTSEFVESDLELTWQWHPDLKPSQRFAVRIWPEDRPFHEIWTVESRINVKNAIDSFSVALGSFFWQVAVVNVDSSGAFSTMASEWSNRYELRRVRRLSIFAIGINKMSGIARQIHEKNLSPSEIVDRVHQFVQVNSLVDLQKEYDADYGDAIELMFNYSQGFSSERPSLLCDGRSTAMLTILRELGIDSRLVFLYSPVPGYLAQHTVLEVFDPERQSWQVHDLAWDFYYVDMKSLKRVSAERILFGPSNSLAGCPIAGGDCNTLVMKESIGYFDALRYGWTFELWVNPDRFQVSRRFEGQNGQNIVEFISDGNPQKVTIRMDSWEQQDS